MMLRFRILQLLAIGTLAVGMAVPGAAQDDEKELGWNVEAELAGVWVAGNAQSNTLGAGLTATYTWPRTLFSFDAGTARTQSTTITRAATGTDMDFDVTEESETRKTAEFYFARGRLDYDITPKFYIFGGMDWLRNQFSGIDSRFLLAAGAGRLWSDTDKFTFKTDLAFTYTFEQDVVENPITNQNFPGVRAGYDLSAELTTTTTLNSRLIADFNLDNTDDIRADWLNSLPIKISETFFFKPSWQLLWRNDPAGIEIPLNGGPELVPTPLKELDSIITMALVMKLS